MERTFNCSMCYYTTIIGRRLVSHYVRCHRFDPRFSVRCSFPGCHSKFTKWDSYKKHVQRAHRDHEVENDDNDDIDFHIGEMEHDGENDNAEQDQPFRARSEILQVEGAKFLLHVKDFCKTSPVAMLKIMEGTQHLITRYINTILEEIHDAAVQGEENMISYENVNGIIRNMFPPSFLFSNVNTKNTLDQFLVDNLGLLLPTKIEMGVTLAWRRGPDLNEKKHNGYQIPFLQNLKRLLMNKDVRQCVDNPRTSNGNVMKTVLDGNYYKTHEFFSNNQNSLAVILYYDEVEVTNGFSSKVHKLGMFYWSLANIYPEYRSTLNAVNLLAVVKYPDIVKFGIHKALEGFVQDIITLQTDGISVPTFDGGERVYKGSLFMVTADTPAAALLGGFKKSVSASKPCRRCMAGHNTLSRLFKESDFTLRNMVMHNEHVNVVKEVDMPVMQRQFWQQFYGVNERSVLLDIPLFDLLKCLVQDIMHVLSEGVFEVSTREFLKWCVTQGYFNLETLNDRIMRFDYGHLQKDKPSPIQRQHLDNKLKQSAAQMICLAHILPFLICDLLLNNENEEREEEENVLAEERLSCHIRLLQICNICFAFEISKDDALFLGRLIEEFLLIYTELYPNTLVPKFHFLIHIVTQIKEFGPPRQQWCMRFEAAHAWFKAIARIVRNIKNMPWTLSYRHENMRCFQLAPTDGGMSPKFLYQSHSVKEGPVLNIDNLPEMDLLLECLQDFLHGNDILRIMNSPAVEIYGTKYAVNSVVLLSCEEDSLPQFGKVAKIYVCESIESDYFFVIHRYRTAEYAAQLNAYKVVPFEEPIELTVLPSGKLLHPHPLSMYRFQRGKYVCLFNHVRSEFLT